MIIQAAVIREYGEPGVLHIEDVPEPEVGPGQVLIRVAAASINPIDAQERAGKVKDWPPPARLAVVVGNPAEPGPYVIRVKVPGGVPLMPHRHAENWN